MLTQDDAELALDTVATYLNCGTEELKILRGDEARNMIVIQSSRVLGQGAYIYQCDTKKVYPVNGFEDPTMTMGIISESRAD